MSFFSKIFKKKPGGTLFGNLLRIGAKSVSGGLLGNGANMIPLEEGASIKDAPPAPPKPFTNANPVLDGLSSKLNDFLSKSTKDVTIQAGADNKTIYAVGGIALAVTLIVLLTKQK